MSLAPVVVLDAESRAFPRELLDECSSALLLFCSGRMGAADGHWVREAGLTDVTAVDWDADTLEPYADAYPVDWDYVEDNVFEFVEKVDRRWDIVSADAPFQLRDRLHEALPRYCSLANKYVTATHSQPVNDLNRDLTRIVAIPPAPAGWRYMEDPIYRAEFEGRRFWWLILGREQD